MNRQDRRRQLSDLAKSDAMYSSFPSDMRAATELHRQGRMKEAADTLRKITKVYADHPDVRVAWSNLGATLQGLGKLDDAVAALKKARALKPDHPPPHHNLGMALAQQGKLDEAIESLQRACDLDPNFRDAWAGLALVREQTGEIPLAAEAWQRAVQADPNAVEPLFNFGNCLFRLGMLNEAAGAFQGCLARRPNMPEAVYALGRVHEEAGSFDTAAEAYLAATRIAPQVGQGHAQLAGLIVTIAGTDLAKAQGLADTYRQTHPDSPVVPQLFARLEEIASQAAAVPPAEQSAPAAAGTTDA
ncbi:MAG: tetratricopeptide repeat protein [Niveispirillum sp.]|uniref:tetratricopeptide repeat protein n=1 Tax=Niveispirillum sp. TaxID=1917217 RepID=UPI003BA3E6E5